MRKVVTLCPCGLVVLRTCLPRGQPETPSFPRPDWTKTGPGLGNIFKSIFGSGQVGEFNFGSVQVRVFLPGYETFLF